MGAPDPATTRLLQRLREGDAEAEAELLPRVYEELHRLASSYMRGSQAGNTLQPTALVHEAYLRLAGGSAQTDWNSREHFVGVAARAMRSVLVDNVRRKRSARHGGELARVSLDEMTEAFEDRVPDLVELDGALDRLAEFDAQAARIVELRFFAGLDHAAAARVLGVSERTVRREWQVARLWLRRWLEG